MFTENESELKIIASKLCLFDDGFMSLAFADNIEATQLLVRIITGREDIIVTEVKSQYKMKTLNGREAILDIFARDATGKNIDIEFQRRSDGANPKRARYYSAVIDTKSLKVRDDYKNLPDSYVIFITETDVLGKGYSIYEIERMVKRTDEPFCDGSHIIYVNGKYKGNDEIGFLIADLLQTDPEKMHYRELRERVAYLKQDEEEISKMTEFDKYVEEKSAASRAEGVAEGKLEGKAEGKAEGRAEIFAELSKIGIDAKQLEALKAKFAVEG